MNDRTSDIITVQIGECRKCGRYLKPSEFCECQAEHVQHVDMRPCPICGRYQTADGQPCQMCDPLPGSPASPPPGFKSVTVGKLPTNGKYTPEAIGVKTLPTVKDSGHRQQRVYIAGPMRGYPAFNFPAFDAARDRWKSAGWDVVSPADLDREAGFNEHGDAPDNDTLREMLGRDVAAVLTCNAIAVLPGWEKSTGAAAELAVGRCIGLTVYNADTFKVLDENILDEAYRITRGDRNDDYGHPLDEHDNIAKGWSIIVGATITAEQVALAMIWLKIARSLHRLKRDSAVDVAGYADCLWRIVEERKRREGVQHVAV